MLAARVLAVTVVFPLRLFHEVVEGRVVLVGDEVARALPALDVAGRVAPGGAGQFAFAAQELQVDRRRHHPVFLEQPLGFLELGADVVAASRKISAAPCGLVSLTAA